MIVSPLKGVFCYLQAPKPVLLYYMESDGTLPTSHISSLQVWPGTKVNNIQVNISLDLL